MTNLYLAPATGLFMKEHTVVAHTTFHKEAISKCDAEGFINNPQKFIAGDVKHCWIKITYPDGYVSSLHCAIDQDGALKPTNASLDKTDKEVIVSNLGDAGIKLVRHH